MNWDLFRYSLAKKLFLLIYRDYEFTEWGNDWGKWWRFVWELHNGQVLQGAQGRLYTLDQLLKLTIDVEGDMVECGAYRGQSSVIMLSHSSRRLHVFDSFEGLSKPSESEDRWWKKGMFAASLSEYMEAIQGYNSRVVIHKGWIPEKFMEVDGGRFSFVHVDVDLAKPTEECIEFFYPRLSQGGVMLFDDYGYRQCREVKRVINENFSSDAIVKLTTGQAFVIAG